jgi:hypothetical protein
VVLVVVVPKCPRRLPVGIAVILEKPVTVMSLAYPSYWGRDAEPCRCVEVLKAPGWTRPAAGKALRIRTSILVPCLARMVGPGKIPLYPARMVDRPGKMRACPSFWVRA